MDHFAAIFLHCYNHDFLCKRKVLLLPLEQLFKITIVPRWLSEHINIIRSKNVIKDTTCLLLAIPGTRVLPQSWASGSS
jgi:hypothetical protein